MIHFYQVLCGLEGAAIVYLMAQYNKAKLVAKGEFEKQALLRYVSKLRAEAKADVEKVADKL